MPSWRLLTLIVLLTSGCTLLGVGQAGPKSRRDKVRESEARASQDPDDRKKGAGDESDREPGDEDDESGVRSIGRLLRKFNKALRGKDFKRATVYLTKSQKAIREATEITRSHPDFDDVEETVDRARNRLEISIERDRIARRNAAIDELMRKGSMVMSQGNGLGAELSLRVVTQEDVDNLNEALSTLDELHAAGGEFLDEDRFASHAKQRDKQADALRALRKRVKWQVHASATIGESVKAGYAAVAAAGKSKKLSARLSGLVQAQVSFQGCVTRIADLEGEQLYDADRQINTRLGELSLADTKQRCVALVKQAREKIDSMTWEKSVNKTVMAVNSAMAQKNAPKSLSDEIDATESAITELGRCTKALARTENQAGYNKGFVFRTVLGKLTATALRTSCKSEQSKLNRELPTLKWRSTVGGVVSRVANIKQLRGKVKKTKSAKKQVLIWEKILGSIRECTAQAKALGKQKGANRSAKLETAYGPLTIGSIEKLCGKELGEALKLHTIAVKERETEDFAATRRGDEVDVIKREGIPTRIETFSGGSIFLYEVKGRGRSKKTKRFGFNKQGKRIDYWVEWRNQIVGVVSELTRVYKHFTEARNSEEMLKAAGKAKLVLDVCQEALSAGQKSPGYDPKASFVTPLGKLNASKLIQACGKEVKRLRGQNASLRWKSRVEKLRDRLDSANKELAEADRVKSPEERIKIVSGIVGSLEECVDRADSLPKDKAAQKRYKVASYAGKMDVIGLKKTCEALKVSALKVVAAALEQKRLNKFLRGCKGDESSVAKRDGVPSKIENFADGRVFIYSAPKGKKAKRIAFDAKGKRVSESVLSQKMKGKPEILERQTDGDTLPIPELEAPKRKPKKRKRR